MRRKPAAPAASAHLRRRAEERLKKKRSTRSLPRKEADLKRLLRALQVQKVELEQQDEGLRLAQKEIAAELEKYARLYDLAPAAHFTLTVDGTIRQMNRTCARYLGISRSRLLNRRFSLFVSPADRPTFDQFLGRVFETKAKQACEVEILKKDGPSLFIGIEAVSSKDGRECRASALDITSRRRMEERVRQRDERYRAFIQYSTEAFCRYEGKPISISQPEDELVGHLYRHVHVAECNDAFARMYGREKAEDMMGLPLADTLVETDARNLEFLRTLIRSGFKIQGADSYERLKNGRVRCISQSAFCIIEDGYLLGAWCVQRDVTERRLVEEKSRTLLTAVKEEREILSTLINSITDEVWFADTKKRFTMANQAALREFCLNLADGIGVEEFTKSLQVFRPDGSPRPVEETPPLRALAGEIVRDEEEIVRTPARGELRHRQVRASPVRDAAGSIIGSVSVIRDITLRKRSEEAVREASQFNQQVIDNALEGIVVYGRDLRYRVWNPFMERLSGIPTEDVLGHHPLELFPFLREAGVIRMAEAALAGEKTESLDFAYKIPQSEKSGWVSNTSAPLRNSAGDIVGVIGIVREITERKRAEDELRASKENLRALAAQLQAVREEERTRVAREIHDVLAQELTRLKMDIVWLNRRLAQPLDEVKRKLLQDKLGVMTGLADDAIRSVQKIATELRPIVLDSLGLIAAIEWQAKDFEARSGIHCNVIVPGKDIPLDRDRATAVFRVLQESLTNVARHAGATRVEIRLLSEATHIIMAVRDNGRGIENCRLSDPHSVGLLGMRERALLLDGQCEIRGSPGEGTTVELQIPLPAIRQLEVDP